MHDLEELLAEVPIISAIRSDMDLERAINCDNRIVFVLYGSLVDIQDICNKLKDAKKLVFIHVDMIDGLKADAKGIEFIKRHVNPYGIITTKTTSVKYAKNLGLYTILRVFILDSQSLQTGINNIHTVTPHAVEVLPGVASKIINIIKKDIHIPIIAGGLINSKKDVMDAMSAGALAVSTSNEEVWKLG
ncbi:MAG: glycerol uptake operon antiterminator regulatory protein [Clostridia bacterium]|nr:glycerol uptake operon antiterminator regulatory protein [Clostridia bacterium]